VDAPTIADNFRTDQFSIMAHEMMWPEFIIYLHYPFAGIRSRFLHHRHTFILIWFAGIHQDGI
jgi:hypothetical protein